MVANDGFDIGGIVLDIGTNYTKCGFSGDDQPKVILHTAVGRIGDKYVFGDLRLSVPNPNLEISSPINGSEGKYSMIFSIVNDWEGLEKFLDFVVCEKLGVKWNEHPIFMVENSFWSRETRERFAQMFFEKFQVPAVFFCKSPVLAAFANGKHSGLVVECGASSVNVVPVYDGVALKMGSVQEKSLGGNRLTLAVRSHIVEKLPVQTLTLPQEIAGKHPVKQSEPPSFEAKQISVTESFRKFHESQILDDLKYAVVAVSESTFKESYHTLQQLIPRELAMRPKKGFEFPNGFSECFGAERYRVGEILFDAESEDSCGIAELINKSLQQSDVEVRQALIGNIILTGGSSLIPGLAERLASEQGRGKLVISSNIMERKYGAWIGGSIVASLPNFQQMWLTMQEYKDHGPAYIEKKTF